METKKYVFKYQTPKTKNSIRTIPMQESVYKALKRQKIQLKEMKRKYKCADFFSKNCPRTVHGRYKQFLYTAKTR